MKKYGNTIDVGKACIVVRGQGLDQLDHEFWKWLHDEGFTKWYNHGHYKGCEWVFINLNSMVYAPGMPGVKIVEPIRDLNGISIDEFKTIWEIFKYRENHTVRSEYKSTKTSGENSGVSPAVPKGARLCHIYEIADAGEAGKDLETELVKGYGSSTVYHGVELHSNHESEGGERSLVRCKKCGALLLAQHSWYEAMNPGLDGNCNDWIPVWSEEEADLLNIFLDSHDLPEYVFKHLRSNNEKFCWSGEGQPRPMDLPELSNAIAMKYKNALMSSSGGECEQGSSGSEGAFQEIQQEPMQDKSTDNSFSDVLKTRGLRLDETNDAEIKQIHVIAAMIDAELMHEDDIGFSDTHLVFTNNPGQKVVTWEKTDDGYAIHLCIESAANWCQMIYQVGYAMMHCLIDYLKPDEKRKINWAEELICEASAILILWQFEANWDKTPMYIEDPEYAKDISEYLNELLANRGTSALLRCKDKYALSDLNVRGAFNDRLNESHDLFYRMGSSDLVELAQVRAYAIDALLLNTHFWLAQKPSAAVDYMCRLQENIPGCDVPPGIALTVNLHNRRPDIEEMDTYASKIRHLRDIIDEWIVFDFTDKHDKTQKGLRFYQVCVDHDDVLRTEVNIRDDEGVKMFARESTPDEAVSIMQSVINGSDYMSLPGWRDITKEVLG